MHEEDNREDQPAERETGRENNNLSKNIFYSKD